MLECRLKKTYLYDILSASTADVILDKMGYGKDYCESMTNEYSNEHVRYGYADDKAIYFGFKNIMSGKILFGNYIVFNGYEYDCLTAEQFAEEYEVIKE